MPRPLRAWLAAALLVMVAGTARAQEPSPHAIDIPAWFALSFLDLREDVRDAARDGKRVMVYFGQDGCPYCKLLMVNNFSQKSIVDRMQRDFVAVAVNMWGDREVTALDGRSMTEKDFARAMNVQFTPTLLFLDEAGKVVARLNGYYPPQRFEAVLEYVAGRHEQRETLTAYLGHAAREPANPKLADQPFFRKPPYDLTRKAGDKPLAVVFETTDCAGCDELHQESFRRRDVLAQIDRFDVVRLSLGATAPVTLPDGRRTTAEAWARELKIVYAPTIVLFDAAGTEVFRLEAFLRPFHVAGSLAYVADGAYRAEPSFQRYLQARTEQLRAQGRQVDLME